MNERLIDKDKCSVNKTAHRLNAMAVCIFCNINFKNVDYERRPDCNKNCIANHIHKGEAWWKNLEESLG